MTSTAASSELLLAPSVAVVDDAGVVDVRRLAVGVATDLGFGDDRHRVGLLATEMATNLAKYARDGRILVRQIVSGELAGVELVGLDSGPGIADVHAAMTDGASSSGTLGGGLGAMLRLSDLFELHSTVTTGTVVLSRLWRDRRLPPSGERFVVGAVAETFPGELICGDAWAVEQAGDRLVAMVVDGLGHGALAAEAATLALSAFREHHLRPAEELVAEVHRSLRGSRGAAVAVTELDAQRRTARFCGVGNIAGRILSTAGDKHLASHYGIAGFASPAVRGSEYHWPEGATLVLHSDGVSERWKLDKQFGLPHRHPVIVAARIIQAGRRPHDDATVLVVRTSS